jgi:cytochrome c-type biogenesis protein CcmH
MIRPGAIATVIALLLAGALTVPAAAQQPRASLPDVEDEVMCTICGTLLAESDSPQAERERALIRNLIGEGKDKDQIKDALVAQYGPRVLATPSGHGFDLIAWLLPILGLAAALAALVVAAIRLSRRRRTAPSPAPPPPAPEDAARLERDLSSYDA